MSFVVHFLQKSGSVGNQRLNSCRQILLFLANVHDMSYTGLTKTKKTLIFVFWWTHDRLLTSMVPNPVPSWSLLKCLPLCYQKLQIICAPMLPIIQLTLSIQSGFQANCPVFMLVLPFEAFRQGQFVSYRVYLTNCFHRSNGDKKWLWYAFSLSFRIPQ